MATRIISFHSGINTCYLIRDRGTILIDTGYPGVSKPFNKMLEVSGIKPEEIKLIVITHGDFDHVGGAKELKELTGADIAIHEKDRHNLEEGIFHWPKGVTPWGRLSRSMMKPLLARRSAFPPVKADLVLGDNEQSLEEFGIPGRIMHTPGHTPGSVSVLLDSGEAFIGCLAHNKFPFVLKPKLPIYSMDIELLKQSLKAVIDRGARILYPGHGKPIPAGMMLRYIN